MTINITITTTPDLKTLALWHAQSFEKGWGTDQLSEILAVAGTQAFVAEGGFALIRLIAGEAEILTLAVSPTLRRHGVARALLAEATKWLSSQKAESLFLEVRESNIAAIQLYEQAGFKAISRRKGYYSGEDAIVLKRQLSGHSG